MKYADLRDLERLTAKLAPLRDARIAGAFMPEHKPEHGADRALVDLVWLAWDLTERVKRLTRDAEVR